MTIENELNQLKVTEASETEIRPGDYVNPDDDLIPGMVSIAQPENLAQQRVYGLNVVELGDRVYIVDSTKQDGSVPVHLEEVGIKDAKVKVKQRGYKPIDESCGSCGAATQSLYLETEECKCGFCGTGVPVGPEKSQIERDVPVRSVTKRNELSAVAEGDVGAIKKYLVAQLDQESGEQGQTVFDSMWDRGLSAVGGAVGGGKEWLKTLLPDSWYASIDILPVDRIIAMFGMDELKAKARETLVGVMLAGEAVQGLPDELLSRIPGLDQLGAMKKHDSLRLFGPFPAHKLQDGRIVAVLGDGHATEYSVAPIVRPEIGKTNEWMPEVLPGCRLIHVDLDGVDSFTNDLAGWRLEDKDGKALGFDVLFAESKEGKRPLNLIIPWSQLKHWDIQTATGASLHHEIEKWLKATKRGKFDELYCKNENTIHGEGLLTSPTADRSVTRQYPFGNVALRKWNTGNSALDKRWDIRRLESVELGENETSVNIPWQEGFKIVKVDETQSFAHEDIGLVEVVDTIRPEIVSGSRLGPLDLAEHLEQMGPSMERAGLLLRQTKTNFLLFEVQVTQGEIKRRTGNWLARLFANPPTRDRDAARHSFNVEYVLLNKWFAEAKSGPEALSAWRMRTIQAVRKLIALAEQYPKEFGGFDFQQMSSTSTTNGTAQTELEFLMGMLEEWQDGRESRARRRRSPYDMITVWLEEDTGWGKELIRAMMAEK